jgi:general secretion pathway protein N
MTRLHVIVFGGMFAAALVVMFPLGAALGWANVPGLSAREVGGSIWHGHLRGAQFRGVPLGDIDTRVDAIALLTGSLRLQAKNGSDLATLVLGGRRGLKNANATFEAGRLGLEPPVSGAVALRDVTVLFEEGQCVEGEGRVSTDLFASLGSGSVLQGEVACDGADAVALLSGSQENARMEVMFRLSPNGHYRLQSRVESSDPALRLALAALDFTEDGGKFTRMTQGVIGREAHP